MNIYEKLSKLINQGDIIKPNQNFIRNTFQIEEQNIDHISGIIVVSNSCDIQQKTINYISFSPIVPLSLIVSSIAEQKKKDGKDKKSIRKSIKKNIQNLMKYNSKKFFFLPSNKSYGIMDISIAMLEIIISIKFSESVNIIHKNGLCSLQNPWREKFGWCCGNMYNRVAVDDFPEEYEKKVLSNEKI